MQYEGSGANVIRDSLTNWLRTSRAARAAFRRSMKPQPRRPVPKIQLTRSASPLLTAGSVGRAYDNWFRIACIQANRLGKHQFREFLGYRTYIREKYTDQEPFRRAMHNCLEALEESYDSGRLLDVSVLRAAFILGLFERDYRTGERVIPQELNVFDANIEELRKLAEGSDTSWASGRIVLNPRFDIGGTRRLLAGDADLLVDGVLYELKTLSELRPIETLRQLLGYVVMNSLRSRRRRIHAVGYYYVRYGLRLTYPLSELFAPEGFAGLRAYFARTLGLNAA